MLAIFKRELRSYFLTPLGYVFVALFLGASSLLFCFTTLRQGEASNVYVYFSYLIIGFILVIPILTMKLFSEEKKIKTEQLLLTSPVSLWSIVVAKVLAAYVLFAATFAASLLNFIVLYAYGKPNPAVVIGSIFGVLLVGAACIAVGMFISSLTENQLVSAIATMAILLLLVLTSFFNSAITIEWIRVTLAWVSILTRFSAFSYGIFDPVALIYYISVAWIFFFLTVRVYERRRWA
jgi:ABC-2 type transport system permease protein